MFLATITISENVMPYVENYSWFSILSVLISVWLIYKQIRFWILCRVFKAVPPHRPLDFTFGFRFLYDLLSSGAAGQTPQFLDDAVRATGTRTAMFKLAGVDTLFTTDPENVKAILSSQFDDFYLGTRLKCVGILLGEGIFTSDGETWKHSRAMLRSQFSGESSAHILSLEPIVKKLFAHIEKTNGTEFDIQPLLHNFTVDSGTDFLYGQSCNAMDDGLDDIHKGNQENGVDPKINRLFPEAFDYSLRVLCTRLYLQNLRWLGTPKKFHEAKDSVHALADFYVKKVLAETEEEIKQNSRDGYVFIYEMLKQTRDPEVLRNESLNILLAARDATAGLLSFTMYELARNPRVFKKLRNIIVDAFGEGEDVDVSLITFDSIKKCQYLKSVLTETLRLYPMVPRNYRLSKVNTTLPRGGGPDQSLPVFLEKDTVVSYTPFSIHRDEEYYGKDVLVFRPERWEDTSMKQAAWTYIPFNGGPRICLGQQFALTEASYVIVRLLQRFKELRTFDEEYPPKLSLHLTIALMDGVNIAMK